HHADDYVHRIGRTGRAGLTGTAISIVSPADSKSVAAIERLMGMPIPVMKAENLGSVPDDIAAPAEAMPDSPPAAAERPRQRGERGGRGGQDRNKQDRGGQTRGHERRPSRQERQPQQEA